MNPENWTIEAVCEKVVIDGPNRPRIPDVSLLMSLLSHYTYADMVDAKCDGIETPKRFKLQLIVRWEVIK